MKEHHNSRLFEETVRVDPVFTGQLIQVQVEHVRLPNGGVSRREVVKHPGAVAVLAVHEGKMILVEQYRKAMDRILIEIPAGKLEAGEDPLNAAHRELEEETGYRTDSLRRLCSFYTSPGFADEQIHLYVTDQLYKGQAHLDADEFLELRESTLAEAKQAIAAGMIYDAKTIMAVYAWELAILKGEMSF